MPDLIETYARSTGLQIKEEPWLKEDFYPLPFGRYIVIGTGSNQPAKNYDYYQVVVELLTPYLGAAGIPIVLLGGKDDPALNGVLDLRGKTSFHQSYYLVRRALAFLGNDSWMSHTTGWLKTPLIALYGSTDKVIHGPHWRHPKMRQLESHRLGRKPSFSPQESPKMINFICPFTVARAVLDLLEIPNTLTQSTLNIGGAYNASLLELIPNCVPARDFNPQLPMAVRYDLAPNEPILAQVLQTGRPINLLMKSPINLNLLAATKSLLQSVNYEVDDTTPVDYATALKKLIPNTTFFTLSSDAALVAALRFKFFDIVTIQQVTDKTRADFERAAREYVNDATFSLDNSLKAGNMEFKTNKFVLSNGKIYLSQAHEKADIPVGTPGANAVRDDELFWCDQNHYMVYKTS